MLAMSLRYGIYNRSLTSTRVTKVTLALLCAITVASLSLDLARPSVEFARFEPCAL